MGPLRSAAIPFVMALSCCSEHANSDVATEPAVRHGVPFELAPPAIGCVWRPANFVH